LKQIFLTLEFFSYLHLFALVCKHRFDLSINFWCRYFRIQTRFEDISKFSGPFGDELIAGSYLQKFGFLSFFFIPLFLNIKYKKLIYLYLILLFLLILFSLIITGNRMPFVLFVLIMLSVFILEKKTRKYFISLSVITILVFFSNIQI
jgi:hypothetical protein